MPIYEYKCKTCGKEFEFEQRITEDSLTRCPKEICECERKGEGEVFRKISKNVGLVFNGKGFYLTDYARKSASASSSNGTSHNGNGKNGVADKSAPAEVKSSTSADKTTNKTS